LFIPIVKQTDIQSLAGKAAAKVMQVLQLAIPPELVFESPKPGLLEEIGCILLPSLYLNVVQRELNQLRALNFFIKIGYLSPKLKAEKKDENEAVSHHRNLSSRL